MGFILAVGKFESIHIGHRALLRSTVHRAQEKGLKSAAMVFMPHPITVLGDSNYKPMFTETEREFLFTECGLDGVVVCQFDKDFAALSPGDFCKKLFCEYNAREIVVGENYRFGRNREGTVETLRNEALKYGGEVFVFCLRENSDGAAVSTSLIRNLIAESRLPEAEQLLGFPFFAMGISKKGRQLGRILGFPTINIYPDEKKFLPQDGVYSTKIVIQGEVLRGITNIGLRPTVNSGMERRSIETHILNMPGHFKKELYDEEVKVEFKKFIRPEQRFDSLDELKMQIAIDIDYSIGL